MILIDTNVLVAHLNMRDKNFRRADELVTQLLSGKYGTRYTIAEVFSETATLLFKRTKRMDLVALAWDMLYDPESLWIQVLEITAEDRESGWKVFQKYTTPRKPLSFVDCLLVAVAQRYDMDKIASFDAEFDGILTRIY